MMIKRSPKFFAVILLFIVLMIVGASPVFAEIEAEGIDAIAITVIIPPVPERPTPTQTAQSTPRVFPINVAEGYNYEGVRELVRIYELLPGESPEWINTDSFTRNGYYYQIAEIIRRVDVAHTVREHTEIVEIPSATNNLQAVIVGLDPTMEFVDEDGYVGILHLDIRSIAMTQDGTRSTSRQVSQTREFPHLSNPDMALIPQTVTANGRTYNLANVDWRTNTSNPIDFNSVAQTFTAVATYTRTATSTVSTGYTTVAEYSGILTRVASGDVRFVATFIGTPIVSPIVNRPTSSPTTANPEQDIASGEAANGGEVLSEEAATEVETPTNGVAGSGNYNSDTNDYDTVDYNGNGYEAKQTTAETETPQEASLKAIEDEQNSDIPLLPIILGVVALAVIAGLTALLFRFKRKADNLEGKAQRDSANALRSRMTHMIEQDRRELTEHADDEFSEFDSFDSEEFDYDEDGDD